ncbi:hypothetical protein U1Q18_039592 [Sarracenia purpurea var. burkii]
MAILENLTRYEYFYLAKVAREAERYEETTKFMEKLVVGFSVGGGDLTLEERNLLFAAHKHVIGSLRDASQTTSPIERTDRYRNNKLRTALVNNHVSKIQSKLSEICERILNLLDSHLIPSASVSESKIFYLKMKGDYNRYLAEFKVEEEWEEAVENAMIAYQAAEDIAFADLPPTHPTRLGLSLNLSVFYYEILKEADKALSVAREAVEEAIAELGKKSYEGSNVVLQLLRDNITRWTPEVYAEASYFD